MAKKKGMVKSSKKVIGTGVKDEQKPKKPSMFNVILHNDDYTPMEFVTWLLVECFFHPVNRARVLMMKVHTDGKAIAGTYSAEVAETKVKKTMMTAKENGFPLLASIEPAGE